MLTKQETTMIKGLNEYHHKGWEKESTHNPSSLTHLPTRQCLSPSPSFGLFRAAQHIIPKIVANVQFHKTCGPLRLYLWALQSMSKNSVTHSKASWLHSLKHLSKHSNHDRHDLRTHEHFLAPWGRRFRDSRHLVLGHELDVFVLVLVGHRPEI